MNVDSIPAELRARPQWICWRYQKKGTGKKPTKVPYPAEGKGFASSTDPKTWNTFEKCLARYRTGKVDGIGYVFTDADSLVAIDLDQCIDDDDKLRPWAIAIINKLKGAWIELSPTGTGLHLVVPGKDWDRNHTVVIDAGPPKQQIETYTSKRFFTVSGKPFDMSVHV